MSNFKGKRMVSEDLIKKLEDIDPSGGAEYTPGEGIEISAENEISIDTDTVATKDELFSGDYDDLTNKPTIPAAQVNSDWNASSGVAEILNKPTLATVATTGAYSDLSGTPTIPAAVSGTNDGTNWTSLTVGSDTYAIPQGGSGGSYTFTNGLTESSGTVSWDYYNNYYCDGSKYFISSDAQSVGDSNGPQNSVIITPTSALGAYATTRYPSAHIIIGKDITRYSSLDTSGSRNVALGNSLRMANGDQIVIGQYNEADYSKAFIIGHGTSNNERSNLMTIDTDGTIVSKNLPAVSGTDGTYQLTATTSSGTTTYSWAAGGSGSKYLHKVKIYASFSGTQTFWTEDFVSSSATAYTSVSDYLTDRGYTITDTSAQPTKSLDTHAGTSIEAIAFRDSYGICITDVAINSSGVATYGSWALQSNTPSIQDEVIAL